MKKNYYSWISIAKELWKSKMLRTMKLTLFAVVLSFTQVFAVNSYSQTNRLSLNLKNTSIRTVLNQIEEESDFFFIYDASKVDVDKTISIESKQKRVSEILDEIFEGSNVVYRINDRQIAISTSTTVGSINQKKDISGNVTDTSGEPLPGVSIVIKGTSSGVVTDFDGNFSLTDVSGDATLVFSFVGMKSQEVVVNGQTSFNIKMKEDAIGIEEVVAIGYGTQKKVNLTGSVVTINSEELSKRPVANTALLLQGKMSGVNITQNSAQPGAEGINISIRGMNSFGAGSGPIVLVDGVEGNMSDIDPDNVESISILKDASSAAIYGSRAANGVILVTTKRGKAGVFSLTYHGNFAVHQATRMPDLVTDAVEYMEMFNIAAANSGLGNRYPDDIIGEFRNGTRQSFNWEDAMLRTPLVQKHNITATGGNKKTRYHFGLGYYDQGGILIGYNYKKYNVLFNIDSEINEFIKFGASTNFVQGNRQGTMFGESDAMLTLYASLPTYPAKLADGRPVGGAYIWEQHNKNPVTAAENGGDWNNRYNVLGKTYLKVTPFKDFVWDINAAVKYDHSYNKRQMASVTEYNAITEEPMGKLNSIGAAELSISEYHQVLYTLYSTLKYKKDFGDHHLNVLAGYSQESFRHDELRGFRKGFPNNDLTELDAGATDGQTTSGFAYEWALRSLFGRLNYDYKGKYLVELNFRRDGSSRFHEDSRYGIFPSLSAGWRVSEESFVQDAEWLSNLKIRASWGKLGNQLIGNYPYQDLLSLGYSYPFGGVLSPGVVQNSLANQDISWESTTITDIGLDLGIKNGLFSLTFDYYNKVTSDILRGAQVMGHLGLSAPTINEGEMKNTGYDIEMGHRNNLGELKYNLNLNFSHFKNELTGFGAKEIGGRTIKEEGLPWDSWYLLEWDGIFQSQADIDASPTHFYTPRPGDIKLKDQNNDGKVDQDDRIVVDGRFPKFSYGFNLNVEWKRFDLSAFFQGVGGLKRYVNMWGIEPFIQGSRPPLKWRDAWSPENPSNTLPLLYFGFSDTNNRQNSTYHLQDASYLRLKNVQIGYNIPKHIVSKVGVAGARLYISGDNLLTFTNYEGADPERDGGDRFATYPQTSIYSFGVKVKF